MHERCSFIIFHEPCNVLFNVPGHKENILIMNAALGCAEEEEESLLSGSSANRSERPFEVFSFSAVNSLRTCVISECKASAATVKNPRVGCPVSTLRRLKAPPKVKPKQHTQDKENSAASLLQT